MHNLDSRRPYMAEAYQIIQKDFGQKRADELFKLNPHILLENDFL